MTFISELEALVAALAGVPGLDVEVGELPSVIDRLDDGLVERVLGDSAAVRRCVDRLEAIAAGVASRRSSRDRGHGGMAAVRGHRTPAAFVQAITGGTASDAKRAVQVGESLLEAGSGSAGPVEGGPEAVSVEPWHAALSRALLRGAVTIEQHDAIRRGLGEPPVESGEVGREVWAIASEQLATDAAAMPVEELRRLARAMRDRLDPDGAEARCAARWEQRSFRIFTDADGLTRGTFVFDDEMGAWVRAIRDSALRSRRGGPRFVEAGEQAEASALEHDPRTQDQLTYDLFVDVLRAGALADAPSVFGARQPGVRMIVVDGAVGPRDAFGRMSAAGHTEDRGEPLSAAVIDRNRCMNGTQRILVDQHGNPLDVGREQRLFTPRQRIALAVRDGGCMWPGCCVPASYCEAHHCDHWHAELGRTDIDRGILLCRFHHLLLHNNAWKITRDGLADFRLHPPPGRGAPVVLSSKSAWAWAWDPPPHRAPWRGVAWAPALAMAGG